MEAISFSHNSLCRGGEDEGGGGGGGSCPGTPEMRRRQEEVVRRLAAQVGPPSIDLHRPLYRSLFCIPLILFISPFRCHQ